MARPKPEKVFGTQPSGQIFTIEGYVHQPKPDRTVVFKTEPTGIIHTIEGYVKPEKPERTSVFGSLGQGKPFNFGAGYSNRLDIHSIRPDFDPNSSENSDRSPTTFTVYVQLYLNNKLPEHFAKRYQMNFYNSLGELTMSTNRTDNLNQEMFLQSDINKYPDRILHVEAWLTSNEIIDRYDICGCACGQDWCDGKRGCCTTGAKIYERISNIATGQILLEPEPVIAPEPEPVFTPEPVEMTLTDPYANDLDHKEASAPTPKSAPEAIRPDKEADPALQPAPDDVHTDPIDLLPYAIGIGVAIGVGSVVMKKKGVKFW